MDFIETMLGVSPDGGSGALEAALVFGPTVIITLLVIAWKRRKF